MLEDRSYMRQSAYQPRWSASLVLVIANAAVYGLQSILDLPAGPSHNALMHYGALRPDDLLRGWVWQLLTFQFLHGSPLHLILNCAMLWIFGRPIEDTLGRKTFLNLDFLIGIL